MGFFSKKENLLGIAFTILVVGVAYHFAWSEGTKAGGKMADCVIEKLNIIGERIADKKEAYRLAVGACSKYDPKGFVKVPVER